MNALVTLKNGDKELIENLKSIKRIDVYSDSETLITEFDSFALYGGTHIFIGNNIFTVEGSDIFSIRFAP